MPDNARNVVPFQRSAEYLHQRAMKNKRANNLLDALELLRRSLEKDPHNLNYKMDQAELLCEMGCHVESNQVLSAIYATDESPNECLFGICCNFYGMNDPESAYHALTFFLNNDSTATARSEVSDILENLAIVREFGMPIGRKKKRAARLVQTSFEYMRQDDLDHAQFWLRKSLEVFKNEETQALLALCLSQQGEHTAAIDTLEPLLSGKRPPLKALCIAARVYSHAGATDRAQQTLTRAGESLESYEMPTLLVLTASDLGFHEMVVKWAQKALVDAPYDRTLLHCYAIARINTGTPPEQMVYCWARIRRVDPDDTIASSYLELARDGKLISPLPYHYQVPDEERLERVEYLSGIVSKGVAHIESTYADSDFFRKMLRWALFNDEDYFSKVALNVLSVIENTDIELLLREFLLTPHAPDSHRRHALLLLGAREAKQPFLLLSSKGFAMARVSKAPEGPRTQMQMPMRYRRVLKIAIRRAMPIYGDLTIPLTELWLSFMREKHGNLIMGNPDGWAAALVYCHITKSGGKALSKTRMSSLFGCSIRLMMRCAREIERSGGKEEHLHEVD